MSQEESLRAEYVCITNAQTVVWQGKEITIHALTEAYSDPDRRRRERAWRLAAERALQDREAIGELWGALLRARHEQALHAGFPDYLAYRRQQPGSEVSAMEDHHRFHLAVEEWVTSVVVRLHEERRAQLGLRRFQPWDVPVDPPGLIPPCGEPERSAAGDAGAYLVQRILHRLPVAAMGDAFEQWAYSFPEQGSDPVACGRQWRSLWLRFLPGVDWSGLDEALEAEWQRHAHLFLRPLVSIDVARAQIGAIQRWAQERQGDQHALMRFEKALSRGDLSDLPAARTLDEHTIREAVDAIEDALIDPGNG